MITIELGQNREEAYPLLFFPRELQSPEGLVPPIPRNPTSPTLPLPTEKFASGESIVGAISGIALSIVFFYAGAVYWTPGIFLGIGIVIITIYQITDNAAIPKRYERDKKKYDEAWEEYERQRRTYNDLTARLAYIKSSPESHREAFVSWCATIPDASIPRNSKKGPAEGKFFAALFLQPGIEVKTDLGIEILHTGRCYLPDIIVRDPTTGILVDIEIDEPYRLENGEPIHYVSSDGTRIDEHRDIYHTDKGWVVVRFSESQIVHQQTECLSFILKLVKLVKDYPYKSRISFNTDIELQNLWTLSESVNWSNANLRESYLKIQPNNNKSDHNWLSIELES